MAFVVLDDTINECKGSPINATQSCEDKWCRWFKLLTICD
jgi:hypothetical protein